MDPHFCAEEEMSSSEDELDLSKAKGGAGRFAGRRVQSVLLGKKQPPRPPQPQPSTPQGAPTAPPSTTLATGLQGDPFPAGGPTPREHTQPCAAWIMTTMPGVPSRTAPSANCSGRRCAPGAAAGRSARGLGPGKGEGEAG